MLRLIELKETREAKRAEAATLLKADSLDDNGRARFDALDSEIRALDGDILRHEKAAEYERRAAGKPVKGDGAEREFSDLVGKFELRQVVLNLDEGKALHGQTAEIVSELRNKGGYRGVPVPWGVLEMRSGETVASGVPNPVMTAPIIDRLFAASVASSMGAQFISIDSGEVDYPVCTSSVAAAWASTETGIVGSPSAYATTDRPLTPANTLGLQMKITRKAAKQAGDALEQAVRRDMLGAAMVATDKAVFLGAGSSGEPAGVLVGSYGITSTAVDAPTTWTAFREAIMRFMIANAATGPGEAAVMIRPEVWSTLEGLATGDSGTLFDLDRMKSSVGSLAISSNTLNAPAGSPLATKALLTTKAGGVPPIYVGMWGNSEEHEKVNML
jgi:HK97 family phage major capsid protein